jgi:F-type H+-transporting ATPase subunit epsilon
MPTLRLEIVSIERKIFDDQVNMVVAPGIDGVLGILPRHAPLLTALSFGELQVKKDGEPDQFFAIGGGFMEVQPDHVVVLADAAEHAEEIDLERAEAAHRRAQELLSRPSQEAEDLERAEVALRRSVIRIKVARRRSRGMGGPRHPE